MGIFGFSIELNTTKSQLFGFSIEVDYSLIVTVVDGDASPIGNADVELFQNGVLIGTFSSNANGVALISLINAGNYQIKTTNNDRFQEVIFDGSTQVVTNFTVFGIQHQYRIKAKGAGAVGDSEWSEILTKNI